ncbi:MULTISPECIES: hypothetical protein [unclassified Curtobacterium]|uniref:hypothetical protein n=1 Tax=unclassified Curtobacterium TaxID=257496 RepID=UPI000DA7D832|nr:MULTISPECIES: hypothetical protein [unclassified Curtobacterium]PZE23991.1 hypothetical protein DEI86_13170 [Curtobacterium sp. MCBD17_028]PZF60590.1 hypothetical protein DEI81_12290 [Curtobacterium sp. MCBD17_013]WIB64359.1 hypothetical protein DEI94_03960 [Curtobacterium sp. MCBD17_040]WIB68221.1 hypothetical protein DEI93_04030 [Curtobacterium sp. MCBD17_035]WIE55402.1 hypothetical protein DEI88_004110 [Curtobacterium sp. MCBD17_003]
MRRIHYAGGYVMTGDSTCKALLRYARALAVAGVADVVQIPVVTDGGSRAYAHLLIGPASQIFSTPVLESPDEPLDQEVIERLERGTMSLQPSRPEWPAEMTDVQDLSFLVDLDYDAT